jgi:hypothetical protein
VTTISRMTHTNIVRYYQAWVEGAGNENDAIEEEGIDQEGAVDELGDESNLLEDEGEDIEDESPAGGLWTNSPNERDLPPEMEKRPGHSSCSDSSSDSSSSSSAWSEEVTPQEKIVGDLHLTLDNPVRDQPRRRDLHSESMENLLELEHEHGLQVSRKHTENTRVVVSSLKFKLLIYFNPFFLV